MNLEIRAQVRLQHGGKCALCGKPVPLTAMDLDHIVPRARGGSDEITNFQPAHYSCNRSRGDAYGAMPRSVRSYPISVMPGRFTLSEAADRYGIARKTLLTQIRRGRLAATMSGHNYLVTDIEMEKYVRERKGKPGTASPYHPQNRKDGG